MTKVISVMFGIGIAVVVFILVLLGIQAFYPEVRYTDFCNQSMYYSSPYGFEKCYDNMTVGECRASIDGEGNEMENCSKEFEAANKAYNKNFFIIASILGVITVVVAFLLSGTPNISAGILCSGIVVILWAFMRGWESTDDKLKFAAGLIIAAIVITLAVISNKKRKSE